jgi:N-hydroxyarylamine O-acetyltransferase
MNRIEEGGDGYVLFKRCEEGWRPKYTFSLRPYELADFAEACSNAQTSPSSFFTQQRVCSRATPVGRITLSDRKLTVTRNGSLQERLLESECEVYEALRDHFGVELAEETWKSVQ